MYAIYVYRPEATENGHGLKMHRLAPFDGIELFSFAASQDTQTRSFHPPTSFITQAGGSG